MRMVTRRTSDVRAFSRIEPLDQSGPCFEDGPLVDVALVRNLAANERGRSFQDERAADAPAAG
jgi:hypothetical protein